MKKIAFLAFLIIVATLTAVAQSDVKTVEFYSPNPTGKKYQARRAEQSCFSFVNEVQGSGVGADLCYGFLRAGENWGWFMSMGDGTRNRLKRIGTKEWSDEFKVPVVKPFRKLADGENRSIVLDGSGEDGKDGADGDGAVDTRASDRVIPDDRRAPKPKSDYQPYERAVVGNIYALRVVDEKNDFYVLFRVDEMKRGDYCRISWKKVEAPTSK